MSLNDPQSRERMAALTLHALSAEDRKWLLDRLVPYQAQRLGGLLSELVELGIPKDQTLVDAVASGPESSNAAKASGDFLAQLQPDGVREMLANEPLVFVVRVLRLLPAGVSDAVLGSWPQPKRSEIQAAMKATPLEMPTLLERAIRNELHQLAATADSGPWR